MKETKLITATAERGNECFSLWNWVSRLVLCMLYNDEESFRDRKNLLFDHHNLW